jgi:hypothetical protein
MSKPTNKQPDTVRLDELRTASEKVARLAARPGGVRVVDSAGDERFLLCIPNEPLPES